MTEPSQHVSHFDAEQLAAFAEGALPEQERMRVLAHMAVCARCRDIVFLAQEPVQVKTPSAQQTPWWKLWAQPWWFGGAAAFAAAALLLGVFLWKRPEPSSRDTSVVELSSKQEVVAPAPPVAPAMVPPPKGNGAGATAAQGSTATRVQRERATASQMAPSLATETPPYQAAPMAQNSSVNVNPAPISREGSASLLSKRPPASLSSAQTTAAPAPAPPPPVLADRGMAGFAGDRMENLPPNSRDAMAQPAAKLRAAASGPMHLQIEHGVGLEDGKAHLTGQVLDQSGAVIPRAVVRLTQASPGSSEERHVARISAEAVTDSFGRFALPAVPAGQYQAQITAQGFLTVLQPVDLQSRDLARSETVLAVGAVSEAVEVNAANAQLATEEAKVSQNVEVTSMNALPSGLPVVFALSVGERSVALDAVGTVFTRREGKRWKRVKAPWAGAVAKLEPSAASAIAMDAGAGKQKAERPGFEITTSAGAVWVSSDGEHWTKR